MTVLSDPSAEGLCAALCKALKRVGNVDPAKQHERVSIEQRHAVVSQGRALLNLSVKVIVMSF
jgi:hypothetical protein